MGGSISNAFSQSRQKSFQQSGSGTRFPAPFLEQFASIFGPGFSVNELVNALPRSQGLFGGQAGLFPTAGGGQPGAAAGAPAGGGAGAPGGTGRFDIGQALSFAGSDRDEKGVRALYDQASRMFPGQTTFTFDELSQAAPLLGDPETAATALSGIGSLTRLQQGPQDPRFAAANVAPGVGGLLQGGVGGGLQNLGFGQTPTQYEAPTIGAAPTITPQGVNIAPQGFEEYQRRLFESQFRPAEREVTRQGTIADRRLQAELAQRGLQTSGTGVGQVQAQRRERNQQLSALAEDASNRASVQRFQAEMQQELANAGFDFESQSQNARNILAGNTAQADAYLKTLGLTQQEGMSQRNDFLKLLGLQEADLQRLDNVQFQAMDRLLNTWLQSFAALGGAGEFSFGAATGQTKSWGFQSSGSGGASAGG